MRPLTSELRNFAQFESDLRDKLSDGHVIGFLLDSRTGDLKKSGLILHPESVLPLDDLLGQRATLFYPDPRSFERHEYLDAVRDFGRSLLGLEHVRYKLDAPAVVLMTYREGQFESTAVMSLAALPMCLWYRDLYAFFEDYLEKRSQEQPQKDSWTKSIKSHAQTISIDAITGFVEVLLSKLLPI